MNRTGKRAAAGLALLAAGGLALTVARATTGARITTTTIAGPTRLEALNLHTRSKDWDHAVEIKTKGPSDVYTVYNSIMPGGHTGWHSHPGPSIVSVVSGTATEYHADDLSNPEVHAAGTSFVDDGEGAHILVNAGTTTLVTVAFQIIPADAPRKNDEPAP
jgi:quercetin dioxygenase-like cupin family protein